VVRRIRICIYNLTGCEGCALQLINTIAEDEELSRYVELHGHLIDSDEVMECDVAVVDGSVTTRHDEELLKRIRERSRILVALGTCASIAGLNALAETLGFEEGVRAVYGVRPGADLIGGSRPLEDVVDVDIQVPGCPPVPSELRDLVLSLILERRFRLPDSAVCHECRARGLLCLLTRGIPCLGPATRAGCNALCITFQQPCWGCRGLAEDVSAEALAELYEKHGIDRRSAAKMFRLYLSKTPLAKVVWGGKE